MSYYPWTSDNYKMYVEMKSSRHWTGRNYQYRYFINVYCLNSNNRWQDYFQLHFSSKEEARTFFNRFSPKFYAARNDRYNQDTKTYEYTPVSLEQVIEIMNQTIKESNYGKRKAKKLYDSMLLDF